MSYKRSAVPLPGEASKRPKLSPEDPSTPLDYLPSQDPADFKRHGLRPDHCVAGTFSVVQPLENGAIDTIAKVLPSPHEAHVRFPVIFQLPSYLLEDCQFQPGDQFRVSLRGAALRKVPHARKTCTYPIELWFKEGIHIRWTSQGKEVYREINTWKSEKKSSHEASDNSWLSTPRHFERSASPREHTLPVDEEDASMEFGYPAPPQKRQLESVKQAVEYHRPSSPLIVHRERSPTAALEADLSRYSSTSERKQDVVPATSQTPSQAKKFNFSQLSTSSSAAYVPIKSVTMNAFVNLIGVAIARRVTRPKGQWCAAITLVDPSDYHPGREDRYQGLKINCFTPKYEEWLPSFNLGDVVILQGIKIQTYHDNTRGTGYANRMKWATFSRAARQHVPVKLTTVPMEDNIATQGDVLVCSPFLKELSEAELQRCSEICDWWKETQAKIGIDVDEGDAKAPVREEWQRVHRLLQDAGPDVPPSGYCDCTVEVFFVSAGRDQMVNVFATDYTRPTRAYPLTSEQWPPALDPYMLKFELWDDASVLGRLMAPGEIYSFQNARMRANTAGYTEGKVVEDKITLLEPYEADRNTFLRDFLERKRLWQEEHKDVLTGSLHTLFSDLEGDDPPPINCTVEVLHIDTKSIFVTDYSSHRLLEGTAVGSPWAKDLDGKVLPVWLKGEQAGVKDVFSVGDHCSIINFRISLNKSYGQYNGRLGGARRLISLADEGEHLVALRERKKEWQASLRQNPPQKHSPTVAPAKTPQFKKEELPDDVYTRLSSVQMPRGRLRFKIRANVTSFYPLRLRDAFYQFCSQCEKEVPKAQQACVQCVDFSHEHIRYHYAMGLRIKDADGQELNLHVNDECSLWKNVKRGPLDNDNEALAQFKKTLEPIIGNLVMVQNALENQKTLEVVTPSVTFDLETYLVERKDKGATRIFCLQ